MELMFTTLFALCKTLNVVQRKLQSLMIMMKGVTNSGTETVWEGKARLKNTSIISSLMLTTNCLLQPAVFMAKRRANNLVFSRG